MRLIFPLIAVLITATAGCSRTSTQAEEATASPPTASPPTASPPTDPPARIRVETIRQEKAAPQFRAIGNVRPRFISVVASGADGIVAQHPIEIGEFVTEGSLLSQLRMESTDLDIAEQEAVLSERRAQYEEIRTPRKEDQDEARARAQATEITSANAARRLDEMLALNKRGAANPTEVKDAQDTVDAAQQNRLAAVAILEKILTPRPELVQQAAARVEAQENHLAFLKAEREKRYTRAPFNGFVVEEHTYVGQWLSKGDPVATIARLDEVQVEVQIDQQHIDQISPGRPVTMHVQGTGNRNGQPRAWPGEVAAIIPRSNWKSGSRSFPVIIRIMNELDESVMPPIPALREGMMAEAEFLGQDVDAILVPKDSMVRTSRGTFIYVVNPPVSDGTLNVRQVLVTTGISVGTWIQVLGEGLEAGQKIVTEGAERLRPFQSVQIME